jgi:hypothetical protein
MKTGAFWNVPPCSLVDIYRRVIGAHFIIKSMVAVSTSEMSGQSAILHGATSLKIVVLA